ncbi:MAG: hypothetical protein Q3963_08935, partial [Coriobacteriaceae bacterium]|nr:hypothetical protein [Coriobacteriaceae bacterium]
VDGEKHYMYNTTGNLMGLSTSSKTAFELSTGSNGAFYFKVAGENKWLQWSNRGGGFRLYTDANNAANSQISINAGVGILDDPYHLDGKTYGLAYHNESATSAALMAEEKDDKHLAAQEMLMKPNVLTNDGILLVAEGTDITMWTFHAQSDGTYTISTTTDDGEKYLALNSQALTLVDADDATAFKVTSGTGENTGKFRLSVGNYKIELNANQSDVSRGFWGTGSNSATSWLNLVERDEALDDDDFQLYTAKKVSVSDTENVYGPEEYGNPDPDVEKSQVVIYTRVWNDTTKRYEFYAVDHNGSLIRCYDTGDGIEWVGSRINGALWEFTEYVDAAGEPTNYYELQNVEYHNYFAPQVAYGGQVFTDGAFGINLNGRRLGEAYTKITAWDDPAYAYAGLKVEDGHVVPCPLSEADDFYFAVMTTVDPDEPEVDFTTVKTIDNNDYGITMKMIDFNNPINRQNRDTEQYNFFNGDQDGGDTRGVSGLLSTNLVDGYPYRTSVTGLTDAEPVYLSQLFDDEKMTTVNKLFLESIHNESGYFEYDSTSNFATLLDETGEPTDEFTVYDQLGGIKDYPGRTGTGKHGQFMPYSALTAMTCDSDELPASVAHFSNTTDVLANE